MKQWPVIHSTFEQSRPGKDPLMPSLDSYAARLDSNADIDVRQFVAIIEELPPNSADGNRFVLKVKSKTKRTVYELNLKSMIASWHLSPNTLVF